jgi:glycosyltransferase involved in cell wall biosynthesis
MTSAPSETPPVLSVVMPLYNGEAYLGATLDGILTQSFEDFELLIMDDGSTDGSVALAQDYASRDGRIQVFKRENRGIPKTVNELFSMICGRFVTRSDADDISEPGRFALQLAHLDAHPDVVALGGQALYMDEEARPIFVPRLPLNHDRIDEMNLGGRTAFVQSSVMMRADAVRKIGGYDEGYPFAQDLEMWLRLAEIGQLENLEDVILRYRFTTSGISGSSVTRQSQLARQACEAAWARRGLPEKPFVTDHWRPGSDPASRHDFFLKWGWQAWRSGHADTARHFFAQATKMRPLSLPAWKARFALILGRKPKPRKPRRSTAPSQ